MNYTQQKQNQVALRQLVTSSNSDFFVTANFNRSTNIEAARKALKRWGAMVDRKLVGKHWSKKPADERVFYYAAPEHLRSNLHWHMMLRLPNGVDKKQFVWVAENCWKQIVSSGSMDIKLLNGEADKIETAAYTTKELWRQENMDAFIVSTEFSGL